MSVAASEPRRTTMARNLRRAIALRSLGHFISYQRSAELRGAELDTRASGPSWWKEYRKVVADGLGEVPETMHDVHALVEFAGAIAIDRLLDETFEDGVGSREDDAFEQARALGLAARWLDQHPVMRDEMLAEARRDAGKPLAPGVPAG